MTVIEPQNKPSDPNAVLMPIPMMPMKAKNDRPQMVNVSFTSMSTAYAKGR